MGEPHELKTWPAQFDAIAGGVKHHEFRRNDRSFKVGDTLRLREFIPCPECAGSGKVWDSGDKTFCRCDEPHGVYSGREITRTVTWVTECSEWGGGRGFVCLSLAPDLDALLRARLREVPKGRWKVATSPNVVGLFVVTDGESIVFVAYTEAQARAVANALNLGEEP